MNTSIKFKARILHVLSQFEVTGAETYAAAIADAQVDQGHEVFIVSDTFSTPTAAKVFSQPIGNRRWPQRLANIRNLRKFVRENHIDFVHAHSRAASWVAHYALKGTLVPLISTVHGRQHIHRSSKGKDIYGERIVAICANMKAHLTEELGITNSKIKVIPNGFDFGATSQSVSDSSNLTVSIIGRATGPKGERTAQIVGEVLPSVLSKFPSLKVQVIGAAWEKFPESLRDRMKPAVNDYRERISFLGFRSDLIQLISLSTGVIGAGRVAVETLANQTPLIAVGESFTVGLVTPENLEQTLICNFGDCAARTSEAKNSVDLELVKKGIEKVITNNRVNDQKKIAIEIRRRFSLQTVVAELEEVYLQARMLKVHPEHIPNLMYHKVPEKPLETRHRIFVTRDLFEKQIRSLSKRGFQSLSFKEYDEYRSGVRDIREFPRKPIFITFDDGYVDNLTNALPVLQKYKMKCTLFVLGDFAADHNKWDTVNGDDRSDIMSLEQKRKMYEGGVEFGAHSMSHRDMRSLADEEVLRELRDSRESIEGTLQMALQNDRLIVFAYPYGYCDERVKQLTYEAGYKYAVATDTGGLHMEDDLFQIFRVNVFPEDSGFRFWKKTQSWYRRYYFKKRGQ